MQKMKNGKYTVSVRFHGDICDTLFNAERLTDKNIKQWRGVVDSAQPNSRTQVGVKAFNESIKFYKTADVFVCYISSSDSNDVEMFVTVTTSNSSPFVSHMGIARNDSYTGTKHCNVSMELHSFAAHFISSLYKNSPKTYMIFNPSDHMRSVMFDSYSRQGKSDAIYIGDQGAGYECGSESLLSPACRELLAAQRSEQQNVHGIDSQVPIRIEWAQKIGRWVNSELSLQDALEMWTRWGKSMMDHPCTFSIFDSNNGETLLSLSSEDQKNDEWSWFFRNPYIATSTYDSPLVVARMPELAGIGDIDWNYA